MLMRLTSGLPAAALLGAGTGLITPLGFAASAASTPAERRQRVLPNLGDAGGPLLIVAVAFLHRRFILGCTPAGQNQ